MVGSCGLVRVSCCPSAARVSVTLAVAAASNPPEGP